MLRFGRFEVGDVGRTFPLEAGNWGSGVEGQVLRKIGDVGTQECGDIEREHMNSGQVYHGFSTTRVFLLKMR